MKKTSLLLLLILFATFFQPIAIHGATLPYTVTYQFKDFNGNTVNPNKLNLFVGNQEYYENYFLGKQKEYNPSSADHLKVTLSNTAVAIKTDITTELQLCASIEIDGVFVYYTVPLTQEVLTSNQGKTITVDFKTLKFIQLTSKIEGAQTSQTQVNLVRIFPVPGKFPNPIIQSYALTTLTNQASKKIYVTDGVYTVSTAQKLGSKVYFDQAHRLDITKNTDLLVDSKSTQFTATTMKIPSFFSKLPYLKFDLIQNNLNSTYWFDTKGLTEISFYYPNDISYDYESYTFTKIKENIYEESYYFTKIAPIHTLGNYFHYNELRIDSVYGSTTDFIISPYLEDEFNNVMRHFMINTPKSIRIEITDAQTNKLVKTIDEDNYFFEMKWGLDKAKTYLVKLKPLNDPLVNADSLYKLTFDSDGKPVFTLQNVLYHSDVNLATNINFTTTPENGLLKFKVKNNFQSEQTFQFALSNAPTTTLYSVTSQPGSTSDISLQIAKSDLLKDPNLSILVKRDNQTVYELPLINTLAQDIKKHWAAKTLYPLLMNQIIFNQKETTYAPDAPISRGEFATFLMNALSVQKGTEIKAFTDIEKSAYKNAIQIVSSQKLINGYPDGTFKPNSSIMRQDVALIIKNGLAYSQYLSTTTTPGAAFADNSLISSYAKDAVVLCSQLGILSGKPGNKFDPKANLTRAEAATIIKKVMDLVATK